jgi:hypothetical protein
MQYHHVAAIGRRVVHVGHDPSVVLCRVGTSGHKNRFQELARGTCRVSLAPTAAQIVLE